MNEYQNQRKIEPPIEFLILIGIWVGCFVVGGVAAIPIWILMTGKSLLTMPADMMNPAYVNALKVIQVVSTVIIFFIPAFVTARIASAKPFFRLGFQGGIKLNRAVVAVLLMLCALPLVGFLAEINKAIPIAASVKKTFEAMESQYVEQVKLIATFKTPVDYIIALFIIALLPALVEEMFFRGGLQNVLLKWKNNSVLYIVLTGLLVAFGFYIRFGTSVNGFIFYPVLIAIVLVVSLNQKIRTYLDSICNHPIAAILVTSLIFSVVHASWYGFIPRMALGMVLGYIFFYTGNLWYSVLGHFFNNALSVSVLYWQYTKDKKIDMEVGDSAPWWAGVLSIAIVIALFYLLKKISATKIYKDSIAASSNHNLYS